MVMADDVPEDALTAKASDLSARCIVPFSLPKSFPLQYVDPELSITTLTIAAADDRWKASAGSSAGGGGGGVGNLRTRNQVTDRCWMQRRVPLTTTHHYACSLNGNSEKDTKLAQKLG